MSTKPVTPRRADFAFAHRLRVRWAEVDPQGIVFNPNYFVYADIALTEFWRALGIDYAAMLEETGLDTFMVSAHADWFGSARFDEEIDVGVRTERLGRSSATFSVVVFRGEDALAAMTLVYVFARPGPPRTPDTIPDSLRDRLTAPQPS